MSYEENRKTKEVKPEIDNYEKSLKKFLISLQICRSILKIYDFIILHLDFFD